MSHLSSSARLDPSGAILDKDAQTLIDEQSTFVKEVADQLRPACQKACQIDPLAIYLIRFNNKNEKQDEIDRLDEMCHERFGDWREEAFFLRKLEASNESEREVIQDHLNKYCKDEQPEVRDMWMQVLLKKGTSISSQAYPRWLMQKSDLAQAIIFLESPIKLQKDCLVASKPYYEMGEEFQDLLSSLVSEMWCFDPKEFRFQKDPSVADRRRKRKERKSKFEPKHRGFEGVPLPMPYPPSLWNEIGWSVPWPGLPMDGYSMPLGSEMIFPAMQGPIGPSGWPLPLSPLDMMGSLSYAYPDEATLPHDLESPPQDEEKEEEKEQEEEEKEVEEKGVLLKLKLQKPDGKFEVLDAFEETWPVVSKIVADFRHRYRIPPESVFEYKDEDGEKTTFQKSSWTEALDLKDKNSVLKLWLSNANEGVSSGDPEGVSSVTSDMPVEYLKVKNTFLEFDPETPQNLFEHLNAPAKVCLRTNSGCEASPAAPTAG